MSDLENTSADTGSVTEATTPVAEKSDHQRSESERTYRANRGEEGKKTERAPRSNKPIHEQAKEAAVAAGATPAEVKRAELKGWTKQWKPESVKAAEYIANHPEMSAHWKALEAQVDDIYGRNGRTENELGRWRQQFGPVNDMLAPYVQAWQMQGMTPHQGLGQLLAYQDALARDPDTTLPQIAQMFKPRDAAKVLQALSQAWGTDLGQVAQGAPYVDPQVQQMVSPLMQELQALKAQTFQRDQMEMQNRQRQMLAQIDAFEQAKDDKGNLKHPLFRELFAPMVAHANALMAQGVQFTVEDVYNQVFAWHPAAAEARAKQGANLAIQAAARTNDAAKQASDASRNIAGSKANGHLPPVNSRMEAMQRAARELGME